MSATITDAVYTFSNEVGRQPPELISAGSQHHNGDFRRYDMPDTLDTSCCLLCCPTHTLQQPVVPPAKAAASSTSRGPLLGPPASSYHQHHKQTSAIGTAGRPPANSHRRDHQQMLTVGSSKRCLPRADAGTTVTAGTTSKRYCQLNLQRRTLPVPPANGVHVFSHTIKK